MERTEILTREVKDALVKVSEMVEFRMAQKGRGSYVSRHEALGIVAEEYHELIHAVQSEPLDRVEAELLDIAVAAVFGLVSVKFMEW